MHSCLCLCQGSMGSVCPAGGSASSRRTRGTCCRFLSTSPWWTPSPMEAKREGNWTAVAYLSRGPTQPPKPQGRTPALPCRWLLQRSPIDGHSRLLTHPDLFLDLDRGVASNTIHISHLVGDCQSKAHKKARMRKAAGMGCTRSMQRHHCLLLSVSSDHFRSGAQLRLLRRALRPRAGGDAAGAQGPPEASDPGEPSESEVRSSSIYCIN